MRFHFSPFVKGGKKIQPCPSLYNCKRFIEEIPHTSQPEVDSTQNISKRQKNEIEEHIFFDFVLLHVSFSQLILYKIQPLLCQIFRTDSIFFFVKQRQSTFFFFLPLSPKL